MWDLQIGIKPTKAETYICVCVTFLYNFFNLKGTSKLLSSLYFKLNNPVKIISSQTNFYMFSNCNATKYKFLTHLTNTSPI